MHCWAAPCWDWQCVCVCVRACVRACACVSWIAVLGKGWYFFVSPQLPTTLHSSSIPPSPPPLQSQGNAPQSWPCIYTHIHTIAETLQTRVGACTWRVQCFSLTALQYPHVHVVYANVVSSKSRCSEFCLTFHVCVGCWHSNMLFLTPSDTFGKDIRIYMYMYIFYIVDVCIYSYIFFVVVYTHVACCTLFMIICMWTCVVTALCLWTC